MQNLPIQLELNFDLTEAKIHNAIKLLEFAIHDGLAANLLNSYNKIFTAIRYCRENEILNHSAISRLFGRLTASQDKIYSLYEVY